MIFGIDIPGLAKCRQVAIDEHPMGFALGAFSNLKGFGDSLPAMADVIATKRCFRVRQSLYWSDNLGHKPDKDYLKQIEKEAVRVGKFFEQYPAIDRRVTGYVEHPLKVKEASIVRDIAMKNMPSGVEYVNSYAPSLGGQVLSGVINEIHGSSHIKLPFNGRLDFSYDGQSAYDANVTDHIRKYHQAIETFYFWVSFCNGRRYIEDGTARALRKAYLVVKHYESLVFLSQSAGCDGKLVDGWIYKSHQEQDHDKPIGLDCTPVIIAPSKSKTLALQTETGRTIATFSRKDIFKEGGKWAGKRSRFFTSPGVWGYDLAEKAKKLQGSCVCKLVDNGRVIGKINPAFRAGTWRE